MNGLIFIKAIDPWSQAISSISKSEFNMVGFYLNSSVSGNKQTKVIIYHSKLEELTLDDLMNNPLIERIIIRPLLDCSLDVELRLAILSKINKGARSSLLDGIYQLVGHPGNHCSFGLNGSGLVNQVLTLLKIPLPYIDIDINSYPENCNIDDVSTFLLNGFQPSALPGDIKSHLYKPSIWGPPEDLVLPIRHPIEVAIAKENALKTTRSQIVKLYSTIVDEMIRNPSFNKTISS